MRKDIKAYVLSCERCQKRKLYKQSKPPKVGRYDLDKCEITSEIIIDYVGPLPKSRSYKYILVATDRLSKFCVAQPFTNANTRSTNKFLLDLFLRFGPARIIRSDNGNNFTSKTVLDLMDAFGVDKKF